MDRKALPSISIMWNHAALGEVIFSCTADLDISNDHSNQGGRPSHVIVLQRKTGRVTRNLLVYYAHFPHFKNRRQFKKIEGVMTAQIPNGIKIDDVMLIADTNDRKEDQRIDSDPRRSLRVIPRPFTLSRSEAAEVVLLDV